MNSSRQSNEDKDYIDKFKQLLASKDSAAFKEFLNNGATFQQRSDMENIIIECAKAHQDDDVLFYSHNIEDPVRNAKDNALYLFALAGRQDKTEEYLQQGSVLGAIFAYAYAGNIAEVERLLVEPHKAYPEGISDEKFLTRKGEAALYGYGLSVHADRFICQEAEILSLIKNKHVRALLASCLDYNRDVCEELLNKANFLHKCMQKFGLTYEQTAQFSDACEAIDAKYPRTEIGHLPEKQERKRMIAMMDAIEKIRAGVALAEALKPM